MEIKVITKPAFAVVGKEGNGGMSDAMQWVPKLWEEAVPKIAEIEPIITGAGWGLMSGEEEYLGPWKDRGRYLAGWEVKQGTKAPDGWAVWEIPETTFATVPVTMAEYSDVWKHMKNEWLPESGYELVGPAHEYYPPEFRDIKTDPFFLYFTVKKK